jgi:hypothetical protein
MVVGGAKEMTNPKGRDWQYFLELIGNPDHVQGFKDETAT